MKSDTQTTPCPPANFGVFQEFSQAWLACMEHVMENGHETLDGNLRLRETLNVSLSAYNCSAGQFLQSGASEDRLDLMLLKYRSQSILPQYRMSYGRLFRRHSGVDQVQWLISRLKGNQYSKSATIGFHVPGSNELSCISLLDCKVRDESVHMTAVYRSQNVYASQPGNVCALRDLQTEIANGLSAGTGVLTLHVMSAHIYENDWGAAHEILSHNRFCKPAQHSGSSR